MIGRLVLGLILIGLLAADARAAVLEVEIEPAGQVWVGQRARLKVTVLVPGWFKKAPRFRLPEVPGLLIFDPGDRPLNTSRTVDGVAMSGTITEFAVFARRAGSFEIPGMEVRYTAGGPPGSKSEPVRAETPTATLEAVFPPGAEGLATLISTRELTVSQSFEPETVTGHPGDAISREIVFTADDVPGMAFPPIDFGQIEGVSVYPDTPQVADERQRGAFLGRRTERATYVWEREGVFTLPTLVFLWWNIGTETLERIELPGRQVTVDPGPAGGADLARAEAERVGGVAIWVFGAALVLLLAALGFGVFAFRRSRGTTEADLYAAVTIACRGNDPAEVDRALMQWLERILPGDETKTMADLADSVRIGELSGVLAALQDALIAPESSWSGAELLRLLPEIRHRLRGARGGDGEEALPALNASRRP